MPINSRPAIRGGGIDTASRKAERQDILAPEEHSMAGRFPGMNPYIELSEDLWTGSAAQRDPSAKLHRLRREAHRAC
jgi:hypothetical protein